MNRLRFGTMMLPLHPVGTNPTAALERDLALLEHMDRLGYEEAWIGEHHSGGGELVASPELFIAFAAARTQRMRFGTGVVSLPYHNPLMVADRLVLLDHLTRGRIMFGVGPGSLTSDAAMLGISPSTQRPRMEEALSAIVALLRGDKPVTMETEWFTLREASLQIAPYTVPHFEIAVAATVTPSGPRLAGRFGTGLLALSATSPAGFVTLADHWTVWNEEARRAGFVVDRSRWRLVSPMHVAPTREQAFAEVDHGVREWIEYFRDVAGIPFVPPETEPANYARALVETGVAVIGTPDDAIAQIERLQTQSGGFGCLLVHSHDWADRAATFRSFELLADAVFPRFQGSADRAYASRDWVLRNSIKNQSDKRRALTEAIESYEEESGYRVAAADRFGVKPSTDKRSSA